MFKDRLLSSLVLIPGALTILWLGGAWFVLFVALAAVLMMREWEIISVGRFAWSGALAAFAVALAALTSAQHVALGLVILVAAGMTGLFWPLKGKAWHGAGILYIGLPVLSLIWLRLGLYDSEPDKAGWVTVLWLFLVVWTTDIGAYACGRLIGGPRLAPKISPKKTWAGLVGGVALAAMMGFVAARFLGDVDGLAQAGLAGLLAIIAQAGDLVESAFKRHFGVKDSGHLIPGHGGLLDRVDGLLTSAPILALIVVLLQRGPLSW